MKTGGSCRSDEMERDDIRYDQDAAYFESLYQDQVKQYKKEHTDKEVKQVEPVEPIEPVKPVEHDVKLTLAELRAQRVAHFQKLYAFSL